MLVDNFSAGILGMLFCILGFLVIGPVFKQLTTWAGDGVHDLVKASLIPLASIIVEPAKVLFLNNAINHGVLEPISSGRSPMIIGEASAEMCAEPCTRMPSLGSQPVGMNSAVINPHAMNAAMFGITIPARNPPTRWT